MPKPFVPQVHRAVPPRVDHEFQVGQCPICGRVAFVVVEIAQPALVGQKPRVRPVGLECPWCLHLIEFDEAGAPKVMALPLDMAEQVRRDLTAGRESAQDTGEGGCINCAETEGTTIDEAGSQG